MRQSKQEGYYEVYTRTPTLQGAAREVLDETVEPIRDGVVEGEIESGWTGNFGSFTVLIDTEGKIDIAVSDYRESDSVLREDITIEQTLREARDFKSNRSL